MYIINSSIFHKVYHANLCINKSFISGETSVGKSTLVNRILERPILRTRCCNSNSTICKIRNSDRIRIITESEMGEVEEMNLTDRCDFETNEGTLMLRHLLTDSLERGNIRLVDVGFPTPVLKVGVLLPLMN